MAAKKAKKKVQIFPIVNMIIMILFVIITLYPVLNTLAISLNDGTDSLRGGIYLLPRKFTWKNYITVLQKDNLITGAYVTVARTVIGTVLALISNAILAFIVTRPGISSGCCPCCFWCWSCTWVPTHRRCCAPPLASANSARHSWGFYCCWAFSMPCFS